MAVRGYSMKRDEYLQRLRRIEGQVRGLQGMISEERYCIDVLTQISSATRALEGVALGLLHEHLRHCVAGAIRQGEDGAAKIDEAVAAVERLLKS